MSATSTLCFLVRGDPPEEVLLGLKKTGFGAGRYFGFGGKVEEGEAIASAALRELQEEAGVRVALPDLREMGHLTFLRPGNPTWSQQVHVFVARTWDGEPAQSVEMSPGWFRVRQLPFERMWQDAPYWLPAILAGKRLRMCFVFADDNETIQEMHEEPWQGDRSAPDSSPADLLEGGDLRLHDLQAFHAALDQAKTFDTDILRNVAYLTSEIGELVHALRDLNRAAGSAGAGEARAHAGEELADCLAYLLKLANYTGVDLEQAYRARMKRNLGRTWHR